MVAERKDGRCEGDGEPQARARERRQSGAGSERNGPAARIERQCGGA
jgi:hypothetical protein